MKLSHITLTLLTLASLQLNAQWSTNSTVNTPVVTATNTQGGHTFVSDGSGGTYIAWQDLRSGSYDIYMQHMSAQGVELWASGGINVCNASGDQMFPALMLDVAGVVMVTWSDFRSGNNYDIYAQRLSSAGTALWAANGVAVCTAPLDQVLPRITYVGSNSAIISWVDGRSGTNDIYAQRINGLGVTQFAANGIAVCSATGNQSNLVVSTDNANGVILAWEDFRNGATADIYAQRINGSGIDVWTANGVAVCNATGTQSAPQIALDANGFLIVGWSDNRSGGYDIYAQQLSNASGSAQWLANGVVVCNATADQGSTQVAIDGYGGYYVAWTDHRSAVSDDVYEQHLNASGAAQWTANGLTVCNATGDQNFPAMLTSPTGTYITWTDFRGGSTSDVYAQYVTIGGTTSWTANGVAVANATGSQDAARIISRSGGAMIMWNDRRNGNYDVYIQAICASGILGTPAPTNSTANSALTVCIGATTTLTATGTGTIGWYANPTGGAPLGTGGSFTTPAISTTTTFYVQDSTSCASSARTPVTVNTHPPVVVNLGSDVTQCGGTVTLDAQHPGATYLWNTFSTQQTITASVSATYSVTVTETNGCTGTDAVVVTINPVPTVNLGNDITQCGGNATLNAGNAGATYLWSDNSTSQTLLATTSGTYSVVVTNVQGCTNSDAINVTINTVPSVALGNDITQCGGTAFLDAGNTGSTYSWSTGATSQQIIAATSATYSVLVTAVNGCTATDAINITINTVPTVDLGADTTLCGPITLDAGNAGATYVWSDNTTGQTTTAGTTGTYTVLVTTSAGCTGTDAINVTSYAQPVVNLGSDIVQCGGTVQLDAQNAGSSYVWNTTETTQVITVTASGNYSVVVTSVDGCTAGDAIVVLINNVNTGVTQTWNALTANAVGAAYQWVDCGNGFAAVPGATAQSFTPTVNGNYAVVVTENSCTDTSTCYLFNNVGVQQISAAEVITAYPNPAQTVVNIATASNGTIEIFNALGELVLTENAASTVTTIDVSALNNGVYLVRLTNENGNAATRITIQK